MAPRVVVIAEDADGRQPCWGQAFQYATNVVQFFVALTGHEIAGHDENIGADLAYGLEGVAEIRIGHFGADVQVADLHQRLADQCVGQKADGQVAADNFDPVRFDEPGVAADADGAEKAEGGALQEARCGEEASGSCTYQSLVRSSLQASVIFPLTASRKSVGVLGPIP